MTYPVQPPEPPAIVYNFPSHNASLQALKFDKNSETDPSETSPQVGEILQDSAEESSPQSPVEIVPQKLPQPETIDLSPPDIPISPELQPQAIEISEPIPEVAATDFSQTEIEDRTIEDSPSLSQPFEPSLPELQPQFLLPKVATQPNLPDERPSPDAVAVETTLETPETEPKIAIPPVVTTPTPQLPAVGTIPQFSQDSQLLNAQTPATPTFDWVVMPSDPTPDASFRLPTQFIGTRSMGLPSSRPLGSIRP